MVCPGELSGRRVSSQLVLPRLSCRVSVFVNRSAPYWRWLLPRLVKGEMEMGHIRKFVIAVVAFFGALTFSLDGFAAMPMANSSVSVEQSNVVKVRIVCNRYRCWDTRRHYRQPGIYIGPGGVWVNPPRRQAPRYYRSYSRHVRWCLNRYRSYNPETDRYRGYDGRYHRCYSPY